MSTEDIPQRGHNKAKRNDLKQVGLALMVTTDFHIPLFHQVYAENTQDSKQFGSIIEELSERYKAVSESCEKVTLVFDKGNNSKKNLPLLESTPFHFVGSLTPSRHPDLLAVEKTAYEPLHEARLGGVTAYRTKKSCLEELSDIKEVAYIYPEDSGNKHQITLTKLSELQDKLVKELEIQSYRNDAVGNTK